MDVRKLLLTPHTIMAFAMAVALSFPCVVEAVSIGELVLQSRPGEPLLARVDLMVESNERIEESCLSLASPDPLREDITGFLTEANLSLKIEGARQYVGISSRKPFDDALARLRLQVKCPGMRSVTRTLTLPSSATTAADRRSASITPEIFAEPIDGSRSEKNGAEERALLLAQQKLLEAKLLGVQRQAIQLQDDLGEIKLQMTQLGVSLSTVAPSANAPLSALVPSAPAVATAGTQKIPAIAVKQAVVQQENANLQNGLFAGLGLALAMLYGRVKSRVGSKSQQGTHPVLKPAANAFAPIKIALPGAKQSPHARVAAAPAVVAPPKASAFRDVAALPPLPPQKAAKEVSEEDLMLEEAGLYAAHNHPAKAVEILQEIIQRRPSNVGAWPLLLSIYSSLANAAEFEKTAREFLKHHKDSPSWGGIQALGRTLDKNNPLYVDNNSHISASPLLPVAAHLAQPVGDILMRRGELSPKDLHNYLDDFDPKKHGRFGGYLVAHKAITLAQLDHALLQQQGVNAEVQPDAMPLLRDIENFLADFDPKRDGSVGEFLASRNAVTPAQLSQALQRQSSQAVAAKKLQADDISHSDKVSTVDFLLESAPEYAVLDLEFDFPTGDNYK